MANKFAYYVGIDPDVDKCGVALWDAIHQCFVFIKSIEFWDLIHFINTGEIIDTGMGIFAWEDYFVKIVIEGGWLVEKSNFHKDQGPRRREKIAKNVGMNHETGILLEKYCRKYKIPVEINPPSGQKYPSLFFRQLTGWKKSTNQDSRDAAMLVFKRI